MEVDDCSPTLDTLPAELLLHILQYIEVEYVLAVVARVCSYFHSITSDPTTWRERLLHRHPGQFPALPPPATFSWARAAHCREREERLWAGAPQAVLTCPTAHYAAVDSVHVMRDVVVSGSRDRGISVWSIDQVLKEEEGGAPSSRNPDMHKGWVWSFCSEEDTLVSGSWDGTVGLWKVAPTGLTQARKPINLKVAVLCTDILGDRVAAGTYDKKVVLLDRREGPRKCTFYRVHSKPVLAVRITERQVWSLSEDRTLAVYDRAAGRKLKKVELPGGDFPMAMASQDNCLWVGDKGGRVHLIDTTNDSFEVVESLSLGHSGRLTSIQASRGSLVTASSDGDIRVHRPHRAPGLVRLLRSPGCGEAAMVHYREESQVLAAGFSNNTVRIWAPRR